MGHCLFMRKGETHTAPVKSFADTSWADIITACQINTVPDTWLVGDQKTMTINGTDYAIDIIGKNHDTYSDGSGTAPLTFQMHDLYGTIYAMNSSETNVGGWTNCEMRTTHLPSILSLMPSEVQSGIKQVKKLTSAGNKSSTINSTDDKLFLLSEIEIFGTTSNSFAGEGKQYDYYKAGNSPIKIGPPSSGNYWFGRSPQSTTTIRFLTVHPNGIVDYNSANFSFGVSFAFCF